MRKVLLLTLCCYCLQVNSQNKIIINADKAKDTISKNVYGHFAEHLGHCIYRGFYVGDNNNRKNEGENSNKIWALSRRPFSSF